MSVSSSRHPHLPPSPPPHLSIFFYYPRWLAFAAYSNKFCGGPRFARFLTTGCSGLRLRRALGGNTPCSPGVRRENWQAIGCQLSKSGLMQLARRGKRANKLLLSCRSLDSGIACRSLDSGTLASPMLDAPFGHLRGVRAPGLLRSGGGTLCTPPSWCACEPA